MKRIWLLAAVAVLGLSIAGFATIVLAQGQDLPPPSGPAVQLPKPGEKPKDSSLPPGLTLPAPGDSGSPNLPAPGANPTPHLPAPSGPAVTIPPVGGGAAAPKPRPVTLPPPGDNSLPKRSDAPAPGGVTIPSAGTKDEPAQDSRPAAGSVDENPVE